jgi:hypothetical protein
MMRPAGSRIWDIARELPSITDDTTRGARMAEMQQLRVRLGVTGRAVFGLLVLTVLAMAVARYL